MIPQANKDKQANWVVSFSFKKYYEVNSLETSEFERILIRMKVLILFNLAQTNSTYFAKIMMAHYADGPKGNGPTDIGKINQLNLHRAH